MPPKTRRPATGRALKIAETPEALPPRPPKPGQRIEHKKPRNPNYANGYMERQQLVDLETGELTGEYEDVMVPPDEDRCIAIIRSSSNKRRGNRCTRPHIKGGRVCFQHGGSLPGVRKAAAKTLAIAALPAAEELIRIALKKRHVSDADRIRACLAILDRAGVQGKTTVEVELKPWQQLLQSIAGTLPSASDSDTIELEEGKDYWIPDSDEENEDAEG